MEYGIVEKIIDNTTAIVSIDSPGECESCPGKTSCNLFKTGENHIEVKYKEKLKIGDRVGLYFKPENRIISAIIIFFIPIVILIAAYYIGFFIFKKENIAILISIGSLFLSFIMIVFLIKKNNFFCDFKPYVNKIENNLYPIVDKNNP